MTNFLGDFKSGVMFHTLGTFLWLKPPAAQRENEGFGVVPQSDERNNFIQSWDEDHFSHQGRSWLLTLSRVLLWGRDFLPVPQQMRVVSESDGGWGPEPRFLHTALACFYQTHLIFFYFYFLCCRLKEYSVVLQRDFHPLYVAFMYHHQRRQFCHICLHGGKKRESPNSFITGAEDQLRRSTET